MIFWMRSSFLSRVLGREGLVILGNQPFHLPVIDHDNFPGVRFRRLHFSLAVELVFFLALGIGVVTLFFAVLQVFFSNFADPCLNLLLRQVSLAINGQVRQRHAMFMRGSCAALPGEGVSAGGPLSCPATQHAATTRINKREVTLDRKSTRLNSSH